MDWLRRLGRTSAPVEEPPAPEAPPAVEASAPGIADLFEALEEEGDHAFLDLGHASPESFEVYSRYGRRMRFADLLSASVAARGWAQAVQDLPAQPEQPYDVLLLWDVLDHLHPEEHGSLVARLAEISSPRARLHAVTHASPRAEAVPLRFALLEPGRMRYAPAGGSRPAHPPLLPAEVERLLEPFRVVRGFTLKGGLREYVAVRRDD